MARAFILVTLLASSSSSSAGGAPAPLFDVVVYGASPSGISAAITAANGTGLRVALLEPSPFVGGMSGPGGIGLRDGAHDGGARAASLARGRLHTARRLGEQGHCGL